MSFHELHSVTREANNYIIGERSQCGVQQFPQQSFQPFLQSQPQQQQCQQHRIENQYCNIPCASIEHIVNVQSNDFAKQLSFQDKCDGFVSTEVPSAPKKKKKPNLKIEQSHLFSVSKCLFSEPVTEKTDLRKRKLSDRSPNASMLRQYKHQRLS